MAMNPIPRKWTIDEYLAYEEETGIKHEYLDGEIYAMSGGTGNHSFISVNCITSMRTKTRNTSCRVHRGEMKVKISESKYVYPDFSVVCGELVYSDEKRTQLVNPTLVGEVTSDSTKIIKNEFYCSLPSLKYYIIIDQKRVHVQVYIANEGGWLLQEFVNFNDIISLPALQIDLPVNDIYEDIRFEE